jgi:hypothetical protein
MKTAEIIALIDTDLGDNTTKKITPAILRNVLKKVTHSIRFIPHGEMLVFEQAGKTTPGTLAPGDYCMLRIGNEIINANYLGGDIGNPSSYDI